MAQCKTKKERLRKRRLVLDKRIKKEWAKCNHRCQKRLFFFLQGDFGFLDEPKGFAKPEGGPKHRGGRPMARTPKAAAAMGKGPPAWARTQGSDRSSLSQSFFFRLGLCRWWRQSGQQHLQTPAKLAVAADAFFFRIRRPSLSSTEFALARGGHDNHRHRHRHHYRDGAMFVHRARVLLHLFDAGQCGGVPGLSGLCRRVHARARRTGRDLLRLVPRLPRGQQGHARPALWYVDVILLFSVLFRPAQCPFFCFSFQLFVYALWWDASRAASASFFFRDGLPRPRSFA
ncbi:hypothetical protein TW95_gp1113 [Pandoravirus inopinatum]|uniref:Uncharacterized protein n=1 Tax=Pandoravirus inopinatum TaxID=1605721 RepID=A0A0B5JDN8_9VIRU|nr:hypothetical protein TW95_gp1113 [Pandoravirus inopinatum]AJF97847.1 hypothetical protein [Pandoravirus inopinatum]